MTTSQRMTIISEHKLLTCMLHIVHLKSIKAEKLRTPNHQFFTNLQMSGQNVSLYEFVEELVWAIIQLATTISERRQ